jgi:uncharacterized membrane protein
MTPNFLDRGLKDIICILPDQYFFICTTISVLLVPLPGENCQSTFLLLK